MFSVFLLLLLLHGTNGQTGCVNHAFLREVEGFRSYGYIPKYSNGTIIGTSGVTVGTGIDLGSKNRKYFEDLNVREEIIAQLEPYFGLKVQAAETKLNQFPLDLKIEDAEELSTIVTNHEVETVKRRYNAAIATGKKTWDELTDAQRTVIASVQFQYGSPGETPRFWRFSTRQEWENVLHELRNFKDDFPTRRNKEANVLANDDGSNCDTNNADCSGCNLPKHRRKRDAQTTANCDCGSWCNFYGDITKLRPKGVKDSGNEKIKGVKASENRIKYDLKVLEDYKECFYTVGKTHKLHPAMIAALASRESRVGLALNKTGYGDFGKAYGIMQCDIKNSGLADCLQFDARSCEHINMLVQRKLVPDIKAIQRKHSSWEPEKQVQGAVAAYNFGTDDVWTWERLDVGTTGNDYSNDVMARAQWLIKNGWTCDNEQSSGASPVIPSSGANTCGAKARTGDCEFYKDCVENVVQCASNGYTLGFAYPYCMKSAENQHKFDENGKTWASEVHICIMEKLLSQCRMPNIKCGQLTEIAFDDHLTCFKHSGPGLCATAENPSNWPVLNEMFGRGGFLWNRAQTQILQLFSECRIMAGQTWYQDAIANMGDNVDSSIALAPDYEIYASDGDCKFYESFESNFPCANGAGFSHVLHFELANCMTFRKLQYTNLKVTAWANRFQSCMMSYLKALMSNSKISCHAVEFLMYENRVGCMVNAGFCDMEQEDEWIISRATDNHGYPNILPVEYSSFPLSRKIHMVDMDYYRSLQGFRRQIGQANEKCAQLNGRQYYSLYKLQETQFGLLKFRTEF